jgi:Xaa-Pro aminopeptidase
MDTLHTVLNRGCSTWDREGISEQEFRGRLSRLRQGMKNRGADLLLIYGDSWRYGHLAFVSHFMPKNRGALALIPLEGEPALVVQEPSRNNPFSKTLTWIDEVWSVGQFAQGLAEALKARGLKPKRVGLVAVEEQMPAREWEKVNQTLAEAEFLDLTDVATSLRLVKSPSEQALLRKTGGILEQALAFVAEAARPGRKEYEIMAALDREARRRGVEDFRFMIARSSEPHIGLRPAGSAALNQGELLLISVAASYQRYWAELGRTFCLGKLPEEAAKSYGLANGIFRRLAAGGFAQPGDPLEEIPSASARASALAYGLGNGIGLELTEEPLLGKNGRVAVEPGMALTLRVCLHGSECGSALIAQPFIVTAGGLESPVKPVGDVVCVGK